MIKLRAMGTTGDLKRLNRIIDRLEDLEVISRSGILSSVGTNRYYREYMDVEMDRNEKETQAESIAFVLASALRIGDTSEYSFPYIAGWTAGKETDELKESIEVIRNAAHDLITRIDAEMVALQAEERKEPLPESAGRDLKERPSALGELRKLKNSTEISGSPEKGMGEQWRKQEKTATSRLR